MTRTDRRTLVRQLSEQGLTRRAIAERLGVSKDTVRRDLEAIAREDEPDGAPHDAPDEPDAPQVSDPDEPDGAPQDAPPAEPDSDDEPNDAAPDAPAEPVAQLPRRVSPQRLEIDLRQWPALRRDLAVLASTGLALEEAIAQAVGVLAAGYRQGLAQRRIVPGPFVVRGMTVGPLQPARLVPRRPAPPEGA
ncbi:HTH domain-containing protein [Streptomyces sp. ID05-04B]|uniref:HTH domain-containing protein n=1 Tax=unclassified Streptomyces TaxID=2593676 RepID=UPI000D203FE0|nr:MULTISPECIES: HTH domain-containing protein [unclassified Streptomyces]AVV46433.1 hypothetical protein C6376_38850 [Streptomyces sp. P3]AVV46492.1 hypothetical protein C6376_39150 [Streptomyces sp. P3]MDX5569024.1 HTH domain-containing protein [Streptomyces sp. ID05-04B]